MPYAILRFEKRKVKRDSVKYVDTFIGGSHDFIVGLSDKEQCVYFQRAYDSTSSPTLSVGERK